MRRNRTPDRETAIAAAIRDGKIDGARADEYRAMWDANPEIIRNLLTARVEDGGLMPGLVKAEALAAEYGTRYDESWLTPAERTALAAKKSAPPVPQPPTVPSPYSPPGPAPGVPRAPSPTPNAPRPQIPPHLPASAATANSSDDYPEDWLKPTERQRITAAKRGELQHGRIQFEDSAAQAAAHRGGGA